MRHPRATTGRLPRFRGTPSRAVRLLGAAMVLLLVGTPDVSAAWYQSGTGPAATAATSVPRGSQPTVTGPALLTTTYTLTWSTTTLAGLPVRAYIVRRTLNGAASTMTDTTCDDATVDGRSGVVMPKAGATQSCTDTTPAISSGTYGWTIVPVYHGWLGAASPSGSPG